MAKPPTKAKPKAVKVPLGEIGQLDEIFQPRDFEADGYKATASRVGSVDHIQRLVKVLQDGQLLDPLEVAPVEGLDLGEIVLVTRYVVIDGHHRLAAYREAAKGDESKRIPCLILEGFSRLDLILRATKQNAKAKLNMTEAQRMQNAWRVYVACYRALKPRPFRELSGILNVSRGSVERIKKAAEGLLKREPDLMKRILNVPGHGQVPAWKNINQRHWDDKEPQEAALKLRKNAIKFEANLQQVLSGRYAESLPEEIRDKLIISALRMAQGIEAGVKVAYPSGKIQMGFHRIGRKPARLNSNHVPSVAEDSEETDF